MNCFRVGRVAHPTAPKGGRAPLDHFHSDLWEGEVGCFTSLVMRPHLFQSWM